MEYAFEIMKALLSTLVLVAGLLGAGAVYAADTPANALLVLAKRDGIQIARRTVAKYREMLGILSSSKRKKLF